MNYIFISYDREDGEFADKLKQRLEKNGFRTWIDVDAIPASTDWKNVIDEAIRKASALVLIMTPQAFESEYVSYEWVYAMGARVSVVPLLLKPTKRHPGIAALQYLDFTKRRSRPWGHLYKTLSNRTKSKPNSETNSTV